MERLFKIPIFNRNKMIRLSLFPFRYVLWTIVRHLTRVYKKTLGSPRLLCVPVYNHNCLTWKHQTCGTCLVGGLKAKLLGAPIIRISRTSSGIIRVLYYHRGVHGSKVRGAGCLGRTCVYFTCNEEVWNLYNIYTIAEAAFFKILFCCKKCANVIILKVP